MHVRQLGRAGLIGTLWLATRAGAQPETDIVQVVGRTPLGTPVPIDQLAANVQQATADMLAEQHTRALADFLQRSFGSVFINEAQSNPLQPDLQYRGFVGSPLLGLSQGIAVYQDGVRLNEPFGDTVNWARAPNLFGPAVSTKNSCSV
ncbi:MAG: TonB-dependent receptor plug domain-containing protein [Gammaproteobacteria bacterium]